MSCYEIKELKRRIYNWANDKCIVDGIDQGFVVLDMGLFRHPNRKSDLKRLAPKRTLTRNMRAAKDYIDQKHEQKKYLKTVHTKEQEQKCTLKYTPKYRRFED